MYMYMYVWITQPLPTNMYMYVAHCNSEKACHWQLSGIYMYVYVYILYMYMWYVAMSKLVSVQKLCPQYSSSNHFPLPSPSPSPCLFAVPSIPVGGAVVQMKGRWQERVWKTER